MTTKVNFTTPFGVARYPHISKPDTQGTYADNKYKTKLVLPLGSPEAQALIQKIKDAAVEIHGAKGLKLHLPFVEDEDANEAVFTFKTQFAPAVFDAQGNQAIFRNAEGDFLRGVNVGPGSVIRLMGGVAKYDKGVSAFFNQVQVKSLNQGDAACGFGAVEGGGFEYEGAPTADFGVDNSVDTQGTDATGSALDI